MPKADLYVKQFPSEKLSIMARFVSFIAGSVAFVLALLTIIDEDILLQLELTPGRSVLFYLGVFSAIFATARSFIPGERKESIDGKRRKEKERKKINQNNNVSPA